jgi:CelD/BcsL family acetyltransferase involved in cellulose biosynthesis
VWEQLAREQYADNPFLSLDWHLVWLKHFAQEAEAIHYVKILDGGRPVGYFPMILTSERFHGLRLRTLRLAGNIYTPIACPLVQTDDSAAIYDYCVQQVITSIPWRLFLIEQLPTEFPGAAELKEAFGRAGYFVTLEDSSVNWIYESQGISSQEYHDQLPFGVRRDTRQFSRRLAASGDFEFRVCSSDLTDREVADYAYVYSRSWKEPEYDPTFHADLMGVMAKRGVLRLGFLYLDKKPIAAQLWLIATGRAYAVKTAYDEAFKRMSVGTVLTWRIIEHLMNQDGMHSFDYLTGDDEYKRRWCNMRRRRLSLVAYRRGLRGSALYQLDQQWLPWIRNNKILSACKTRAMGYLDRVRPSPKD